MSAQLSFDKMCFHRAPSSPLSLLSNWPVVVIGKLDTIVVCRFSPLISFLALTIHTSTLAVTVTWRCHLVLHTSAQISQSAIVLTIRDFTLSNNSVPQKTVDWIRIVTLKLMSLGRRWNPFEDGKCKQLVTILRLLMKGMLCYDVAAFSEANLAIFTPLPLLTYWILKGLRCASAL